MKTNRPGYFDLQVNGFAGVDFNADDLDTDALHAACAALAAGGVEGILATIITDHVEIMERRLMRLAQLRGRDALASRLIAGVHIEGPFINERKGYRGAHPVDAIRSADVDGMARLLAAADGLTRLVTLAPERDPGLRVTRMLAGQGIVVAAGHTDAGLDDLRAALDVGLTMVTHLGYGCPPVMPRHDNIIQRTLSLADRLWLCFIADGVHIPFFALRNYLHVTGYEQAIVVTDAIAAAGLGPGSYRLGRRTVEVGADLVARADAHGTLAGSTGTMARSERNLREVLGLPEAVTQALLVDNPRRAIGHGVFTMN
jgi:N-acetylglucosamine-6-phosphate deacetylase